MKKASRFFVICLVMLGASAAAFAGQYSEAFPQYLTDHRSDAMVTAIVTMTDKVDLRALQDGLYAQHADRRLWHETVVRALQTKATESQADLLATLASLAQSGQVEKYTSLWVGNIVIVTATPAVFDQLVSRDDVLQICPDYDIETIEPVHRGEDTPSIAGHEIGATRLHVPEVWAMGYTGDGRLVSHLDTGVDGNHPAYNYRWRGVADTRYAGHPGWAWFDPVTNTDFPFDSGQHGTHTMGTICGRSTTTSDTVGVAIDAEWISCGVIDRGGIGPTVTNALLSFQWVVDPDEDPSTVWDVPDVNSNSWGVTTGHGYPPCDDTFWSVLDGCEAAGIVVVFAAGNEGYDGPRSLRRPADRATTDLTSFSVGAVNGGNPSLPIADFSSRGPSACTPDGSDTFKPEVVAPGVNVRSSIPGGGYQSGWDGTSMATPHIAGIVALMRQANPNLSSEQVRQILLDTADDLPYGSGDGEENTYGKGVANALTAVNLALSYLQGWGTLGGIITDAGTGNPIQGARISVVGRPWGASSRATGQYFLFAPADTLWQLAVEYPPIHFPVNDTVTLAAGDTVLRNYVLEGRVAVTLKASFGNPTNVDYRSFYIKGTWDSSGFYNGARSAPLIEIKDNGVAPDSVNHDGIFTGRVYLARDTVHTFSWSVHSETYGGVAALLQTGADFQVLTLSPPTVPTLSVNPSGSENNWVISASGDHSLNLDLVRPYGSRTTRWGAACSLFVPNTYAFKFKVMHSEAASYGSGGVGGPELHFTPTVTGPYIFVFDDLDDTYYIQMSGTQGPPTSLAAVSGLDHHITLTWRVPVLDVLAGYNVYRDTLPFPFDRNLKVNSALITTTNYDDHGGLQGHIQNGRPYYYQASAVYDIGGGQLVEAGPSNQATATPQNHAPNAPASLTANVVDRDVHLRWHFIDDTGDLSHFSVERQFAPNGAWTEITTTTDTSFMETIPVGQDGTYAYRVTAYDDGTPQMASSPSNIAYILIGHLPPSSLTATNGQEFQVPLHWTLPGSWRLNSYGGGDIPIIAGRGGPDSAGYGWVDSDEPDGPVYQWRDITGTGVQIPLNADNQNLGPFNIGFDFPFYGATFNSFYICSNGWISFTDGTHNYNSNRSLPSASGVPFNLVAPFWDDLTFSSGGQAWYQSDGSELVISFIAVPHNPSGGPYTFQAILRGSGVIIYQYQTMNTPLNMATIGIQNGNGTVGVTVNYNANYLRDNFAVRLQRAGDGFSPAHFKLYRSLTSPVPIDQAHLIAGSIPGIQGSYLDNSGVQNGTAYYYRITAVWPDSVESSASNETSGTPANHQPEPPIHLAGQVVGRDISMHWAFTNLMNDLAHFNLYKKLLPDGNWTLTGSVTDTLGTISIPAGEDGVYDVAVAAVDNGTPPMESWYSNSLTVSVGHLPPTQLYARNNFDQAVPLSWMRPGTWRLDNTDGGDIPIVMGRGGPDSSGYTWVDSDEPDGPIYQWREITDRGMQIPLNADNQNLGWFGIGFDFPFYGATFNSFRICSNGWISFTDSTHNYSNNHSLPSTSATPFNLVAPFWDDLTFVGGGQAWYFSDGSELVISFVGVPHTSSGGPYTFQMILRSSGTILFQYETMNTPLNSATVGIQNGTGTIGLQVNYNADYLHSNMAIRLQNASEGTSPAHYKLYRATSSPVPVDPGHLITAAIAGDRLSYTDSSNVQNGTTYYYVMTAVWPDSTESPTSNEVNARPVMGARISLNPTAIDITGQSGQVALDTVNIANPGGLDLTWNIFAQSEPFLDILGTGNSSAIISAPIDNIQSDRADNPDESDDPPALFGRGGPDAFGYLWIDSDEPSGPAYQWVDITGRGTQLTMTDNDNQGPFTLGFNFHFYDSTFTSLRICSNGWVSFNSTSRASLNYLLPSTSAPPSLIAPFWDDLDPAAGGQVWYYQNADSFVVSWINVPHRTTGGPYTFQIVLLRAGAIFFNYSSVAAPLNNASIGIQNSARTVGLSVSYRQVYVHNNLSTRISTAWISAQPVSGTLPAGGNTNVTVTCNAANLPEGTYNGTLLVSGRDINHIINTVVVPVVFHVTITGIEGNNSGLPNEFDLSQNYPNPFNPTTEIRFNLPTQSHVSLEIYNLVGQKVKTLVNVNMEPGYKSVIWDGADDAGRAVSSGIYFYRLVAGNKAFTRKMTMLK